MKPTKRAIFLDLQGTLGGEGLGDVRDFSFYPYAPRAVRRINESHFLAVVITNQSHIGAGRFSYADYERRLVEIESELAQQNAHFDAVYCCPHTENDGCGCKKPLPGLVARASRELGIDASRSFVVGDMGAADMRLATNVGADGILVLTGVGMGSLGAFRHTWADVEPVFVAENIAHAVDWIMLEEAGRSITSN